MSTTPINVSTQVDTSGLRAGMQDAVNTTRSQLAILKEQYREASADIRQSVNRIVDAEKQAAEAAAQSHHQLASAFQDAADQERSALDGLISKQQQLKSSTDALSSSHARQVTDVQAASGAIRLLEGNMTNSIRAAERFAVTSLGLGPILRAAFPIVGAVALAEVIVQLTEKVYDYITGIKELKSLNDTVGKQLEEQSQEYARYQKHLQETQIALEGVVHGKASENAARFGLISQGLSKDQTELDKLQVKLQRVQAEITKLGTAPPPVTKVGRGGAEYQVSGGGVNAEDLARIRDLRDRELPETLSSINTLRKKIEDENASLALDQAKTLKDAQQESLKAAREHVAKLRQSDEDALADLRADHELTITETIQFWQRRLSAEQGYGERVREIKRSLGSLYQQADREVDRIAEEDRKQAQESLKKDLAEAEKAQKQSFDNAFKALEDSHRLSQQEIIDYWTNVKGQVVAGSALYEESINRITAAIQRQREEQERINDLRAQGAQQVDTAGISQQRAQLDRAQSLDLHPSQQSKIATLEAERALDQKLIDQQLATARKLAAIDYNDPVKYQQDLNKIAQIQAQGDLKIYQDTTKILQQIQVPWRNLFNTINTGFTNALNGALTGARSFGSAMKQIYVDLALQEIDYVALFLLKEAEKWAFSKILAITGLTAVTAAQTAQTATKSAANVAEAQSDAALAAAGTFAWWSGVFPPAAGPAAEAALAVGEAFAGLAAFETGGIIPNTGVALVHQGEAVLPRQLTNVLMNAAGNSNTTNYGAFHYHEGSGNPGSGGRQRGQDFHREFAASLRRRNVLLSGAR